MLSRANARPRAKREEAERVDLERIALAPSIRVKLEWIFVKLFLKVIRLYLDRNKAALFNGYFANVMVSYCCSPEYAIIRSIHPESFLKDIIIVSHLL